MPPADDPARVDDATWARWERERERENALERRVRESRARRLDWEAVRALEERLLPSWTIWRLQDEVARLRDELAFERFVVAALLEDIDRMESSNGADGVGGPGARFAGTPCPGA